MGYRSPLARFTEALDELIAARPRRVAAIEEFEAALRDSALTLIDQHTYPKTESEVRAKAFRLLEGLKKFPDVRQSEYVYESEYLRAVYLARPQFEAVFDLTEANDSASPGLKMPLKRKSEMLSVALMMRLQRRERSRRTSTSFPPR